MNCGSGLESPGFGNPTEVVGAELLQIFRENRKNQVASWVLKDLNTKCHMNKIQIRKTSFFFIIFIIKKFIYVFLVVLSLCCCTYACSSWGYSSLQGAGFSLWWLLLLQSMGSEACDLSSCGAGAFVVLQHVGSS